MGAQNLTVCELFAGVGGFHLGLKRSGWNVIWSNQWEPGKKEQHASRCYQRHFPDTVHVNDDIGKVKDGIPAHTLLVGGFPCQDYSVATTKANGITGKKGVLWWQIDDILGRLIKEGHPVPYVLLENVDRLVRSPAKQRGRDFGIILECLNKLGYSVEWRVINAADYGFPQKRRRTFIFATRSKSAVKRLFASGTDEEVILDKGFFAPTFPIVVEEGKAGTETELPSDLQDLSDNFQFDFQNSGYMHGGRVYTIRTKPSYKGKHRTLGDMLLEDALEEFYVDPERIGDENDPPEIYRRSWRYCKGAKAEHRKHKNGFEYDYTEGAIPFPDKLHEPSRTMLTSDGSRKPNRVGHIILDPITNRYRVLTPVEAERLDGFEDNWTEGMPLGWRYFCTGNALVVGLIEKMGKRLKDIIESGTPRQVVKTLDHFS